MKIRRYIGSNAQEAILKVKMDLGNDAIILNTRKIRQKGFFKFFAKPLVEVLAAIDEDSKKVTSNPKQGEKADTPAQTNINNSADYSRILNLENKVNDMEGILRKLYLQLTGGGKVEAVPEKQASRVAELFNNTLLKNEVDTEVIEKILVEIQNKYGSDVNMNDAATAIYGHIFNILGKAEPIQLKDSEKQHKVVFIGPTGVGKTTTIAKLAADFVLNKNKSIGLITADTYRIAAIDQLKKYAEILNIPVSVIYSPSEIKEAVEGFKDKDIILIDTAGRSHRKKNQMDELKNVVESLEADEVFLVVSANTRVRDYKEIIDIYGFLPNYKLIITKIDETNSVGNVLNLKYYSNKPLSYITTGQSVPDDIEVLNIDRITRSIMGSMRYDGSS